MGSGGLRVEEKIHLMFKMRFGTLEIFEKLSERFD